ncbi:hypothetical protein BD289DRAFT_442741 [Coniella lustricola]|uniref:Uncharacterized protein n=1 Tax=Coniella lustricola TaxID=2025994 RepID=A0A2T2ZXX0_9PEZI|nr:hypothetical protein BD289DRAFT_442741 [Coniella lustricola]
MYSGRWEWDWCISCGLPHALAVVCLYSSDAKCRSDRRPHMASDVKTDAGRILSCSNALYLQHRRPQRRMADGFSPCCRAGGSAASGGHAE